MHSEIVNQLISPLHKDAGGITLLTGYEAKSTEQVPSNKVDTTSRQGWKSIPGRIFNRARAQASFPSCAEECLRG